jgi:hypothetical protein
MKNRHVKLNRSIKNDFPEIPLENLDNFVSSLVKVSDIKNFSLMTDLNTVDTEDLSSSDNPKIRKISSLLIENKNKLLFIIRVLQTKMLYLALALIENLNNRNYLVFALCTRALFEQAGFVNQIYIKTTPQIRSLINLDNHEKVYSLLKKNIEILDSYFYCSKYFNNVKQNRQKSINVMELIDNLTIINSKAKNIYDFLSEFVHPNYGSNLFVYEGTFGEGIIDPPIQQNIELIEEIIESCIEIIAIINNRFYDVMRHVIIFNDYIDKSLRSHSKISYIFRKQKYKFNGSGSRKDPIHFINTRTHYEHVEMHLSFLRDKNYEIIDFKTLDGLENGFIYYLYETKEEDIWFRIPC